MLRALTRCRERHRKGHPFPGHQVGVLKAPEAPQIQPERPLVQVDPMREVPEPPLGRTRSKAPEALQIQGAVHWMRVRPEAQEAVQGAVQEVLRSREAAQEAHQIQPEAQEEALPEAPRGHQTQEEVPEAALPEALRGHQIQEAVPEEAPEAVLRGHQTQEEAPAEVRGAAQEAAREVLRIREAAQEVLRSQGAAQEGVLPLDFRRVRPCRGVHQRPWRQARQSALQEVALLQIWGASVGAHPHHSARRCQ